MISYGVGLWREQGGLHLKMHLKQLRGMPGVKLELGLDGMREAKLFGRAGVALKISSCW
jgi:hypothetical protein